MTLDQLVNFISQAYAVFQIVAKIWNLCHGLRQSGCKTKARKGLLLFKLPRHIRTNRLKWYTRTDSVEQSPSGNGFVVPLIFLKTLSCWICPPNNSFPVIPAIYKCHSLSSVIEYYSILRLLLNSFNIFEFVSNSFSPFWLVVLQNLERVMKNGPWLPISPKCIW